MAEDNHSKVDRVRAAWRRRVGFHSLSETDAYRVLHGYSEGAPGWNIERFASAAVVTHPETERDWLEGITNALTELDVFSTIVTKARDTRGATTDVAIARGEPVPARTSCREHGLCFEIDLLAPQNAGLYLDGRPARRFLLDHARERRVLNLFAHTGSLGVAAAVGGARRVVHVETQRRKREIIRRNHEANGVPIDPRDVSGEDAYRMLRHAASSGNEFDGVVLDPPPIAARRGGRSRPRAQDFDTLIPLASQVVAPEGWLLCFLHRQSGASRATEERVLALAGDAFEVMWRDRSGDDFPEDDPEKKLRFLGLRRR